MRIRQIETICHSLYERKLIKLDFILSRLFTRMGLPKQTQKCAPTAETLYPNTRTDIWGYLEDLIQGGEVVNGHPTIERIGITYPCDQRSSTFSSYHLLNAKHVLGRLL